MGENVEGKILLARIRVPVYGPRGGKIPLSRNELKPHFNPKATKQIPAWIKYSAAKKHWQKNIPLGFELNILPPKDGFRRFALFNRLIPKGGRRYDDDNFSGGCKPVRDVLTENGIIYDDDPMHFKAKYIQTKGISDTHQLVITIWGEKMEGESLNIPIHDESAW